MKIGHIDLDKDVLIVAEIGNNHEGRFEVAKELVRQAAACGVHAVKFQILRARYLINNQDAVRFARLTSFELSYPQFEELHALAKSLGMLFLSTPLGLESAAFLETLVDAYKIASGDNNFYPLIERACRTGKPIIVSSGVSDLQQITRSKHFIEQQWAGRGIRQQLAVLHCVSSYPVPAEEANLASIPFMAAKLGCTIGYSDHTLGIDAATLAVALGARIVEKHFTLDKKYSDFRDHQLSADPTEMKNLVQQIARVRTLLGKPEKVLQPSEAKANQQIRRSIVAGADLSLGHRLSLEDLTWIRPAAGLAPGEEAQLVGRTLKRDVSFGEVIQLSDLE